MSNIDKRALREAAEKAISEEGETWWNEEQLASDYGLALHRPDAKFIAAANPSTVLALLDELEAKDKQIAELEAVKCKLSDSKLLSLAKDIVENLVDTGSSEPEYTQQYVDWTCKRIRAAGINGEG